MVTYSRFASVCSQPSIAQVVDGRRAWNKRVLGLPIVNMLRLDLQWIPPSIVCIMYIQWSLWENTKHTRIKRIPSVVLVPPVFGVAPHARPHTHQQRDVLGNKLPIHHKQFQTIKKNSQAVVVFQRFLRAWSPHHGHVLGRPARTVTYPPPLFAIDTLHCFLCCASTASGWRWVEVFIQFPLSHLARVRERDQVCSHLSSNRRRDDSFLWLTQGVCVFFRPTTSVGKQTTFPTDACRLHTDASLFVCECASASIQACKFATDHTCASGSTMLARLAVYCGCPTAARAKTP